MDNLLPLIAENLLQHRSVVLVGLTDAGKTYWIKNDLIPYLEAAGKSVAYLRDGSESPEEPADIVICDEAETLFDEESLQRGDAMNYYSGEYLGKVHRWHQNYASFPPATLFVITRNKADQIENLVRNFRHADWDGRDLVVFKFER